jgi:hypothetical protein
MGEIMGYKVVAVVGLMNGALAMLFGITALVSPPGGVLIPMGIALGMIASLAGVVTGVLKNQDDRLARLEKQREDVTSNSL